MDHYTEYINKEQFDLALIDINHLLEGDHYNIELLTIKAEVLNKLEQYVESIAIYNSLINLFPDQAKNYADRGLCYHFLSQNSESLTDFSKAIDLEPENPYRYASRAFIKDAQGDSLGALDDYEIAIRLDPEDAIALNNKGLIEEKLGRALASDNSFKQSDKISGITFDTGGDNQQKIAREKPIKSKMGFNFFYTTLMGLLNSSVERKKFYRFIMQK